MSLTHAFHMTEEELEPPEAQAPEGPEEPEPEGGVGGDEYRLGGSAPESTDTHSLGEVAQPTPEAAPVNAGEATPSPAPVKGTAALAPAAPGGVTVLAHPADPLGALFGAPSFPHTPVSSVPVVISQRAQPTSGSPQQSKAPLKRKP